MRPNLTKRVFYIQLDFKVANITLCGGNFTVVFMKRLCKIYRSIASHAVKLQLIEANNCMCGKIDFVKFIICT